MFPIKRPPQYCEKRQRRRLGRVPATPRHPRGPGTCSIASPSWRGPTAGDGRRGRAPSPPAAPPCPAASSLPPTRAGDVSPHPPPWAPGAVPALVPAFLALVEAVLAVEDVAVPVMIQVAHGQEGGRQAPGEAGVPRGWGGANGGQGAGAGWLARPIAPRTRVARATRLLATRYLPSSRHAGAVSPPRCTPMNGEGGLGTALAGLPTRASRPSAVSAALPEPRALLPAPPRLSPCPPRPPPPRIPPPPPPGAARRPRHARSQLAAGQTTSWAGCQGPAPTPPPRSLTLSAPAQVGTGTAAACRGGALPGLPPPAAARCDGEAVSG